MRDLHDPTPFIRGIVAELGPERKEIEYEQPRRRAGKTRIMNRPLVVEEKRINFEDEEKE